MSLAPTGASYAGPAAGTGAGWINAEFEHLERAIRGSRLVDGRALSSDLFTGTSADMAVALSSLSMGQVAGAGSAVRRPHLGRRVYLTGQPPQAAAQEQLSDVSREWSHVDKTSIAELEMLLSRHGSSAEADYARARLAPLKKQQADLAQQAADAAKMKADDEASTKAEAARQCLAMLQQREAEAAKKRAEATDAATPGRVFRDCANCPEMVVVPAGRFTIGSPTNEPERLDGKDQLAVTIAKPFAVGRYAVTRSEFAAFVAATGHKTDGGCNTWNVTEWEQQSDKAWRSPGFMQNDRHSVVCVNWDDAKAYVAWLLAKTGKSYRLP
jgi:hypothetical protein